jgi:hypothetical protein
MNSVFADDTVPLDPSLRKSYRRDIARLPLTMRPALNKQLSGWDDLFPFEQNRFTGFLRGISLLSPSALDSLTLPLRKLEVKMDVEHWNFSADTDTMQNASQLARSPYYAEWREEVQRVFVGIEKAAPAEVPPAKGRMIFLVFPESLPITSVASQKPWDPRGTEFRIDGDARQVSELALRGDSGLPALLAADKNNARYTTSADCWLIDAEAQLGSMLSAPQSVPLSLLEYANLKSFRDQFLAQVNTVPKDIEATDQILERMRRTNWDPWWPASLAGQRRLRSFMVELFLSGNGALIFSNAFVEWAASEVLRRARPRLIVSRFGLRSKPKPFTGIAIFENQQKISALHDEDDPEGSAIDALILARYIWLSSLRYPEKEHTCCVCVAESSRSLYVIAPEGQRPDWPACRSVSPVEICTWMRSSLLPPRD